jgi:hypothetical protein
MSSSTTTTHFENDGSYAAPRLEQMHVAHGEPQLASEMLPEGDVATGAANAARFARRHLAEERLVDRIDAMGDRGHFDHEAGPGGAHVAGVFAERSLRLANAGGHDALDHDLGVRRHFEIVGLAPYDLQRRAPERAGNGELVAADA